MELLAQLFREPQQSGMGTFRLQQESLPSLRHLHPAEPAPLRFAARRYLPPRADKGRCKHGRTKRELRGYRAQHVLQMSSSAAFPATGGLRCLAVDTFDAFAMLALIKGGKKHTNLHPQIS